MTCENLPLLVFTLNQTNIESDPCVLHRGICVSMVAGAARNPRLCVLHVGIS